MKPWFDEIEMRSVAYILFVQEQRRLSGPDDVDDATYFNRFERLDEKTRDVYTAQAVAVLQAVGNIIGDGLQERFHQLSEDQRAAMLWQDTRADKRDCDVRAEAFEAARRECAVLCNQNLGEDTAKKLRLTYEVRSEALSRKDYDDRYPDVGPAMPWTFYVNEALRRRGLTENDVFFEELMA